MSPSRRAAFSLIEVLVAAALTAVIAALVARGLHDGRVQATASESAATDRLALDVASAVLVTELRRAGYRPADTTAGTGTEPALTIEVRARGDHGDAIEVRSLDDRVSAGPVERDWRFDVAVDARGEPQLYRRTGTGTRQPIVQGITELSVQGFVAGSTVEPVGDAVGRTLHPSALVVRVTSVDGRTRTVVVPLPSRPKLVVTVGP